MKKNIGYYGVGIILVLGFIGLVYSGYKIINYQFDNKEITTEIRELEDITPIIEEDENLNAEIVNPPKNKDDDETYWKYINLPLMKVDFKELKKKNSDVVAYLKVNGTNIAYPIVQTSDNTYYLNHTFNKKKNVAGWTFLDYRNDINILGSNTIIYGHGMTTGAMFGTLKNILTNGWYQNTDNYTIHMSTENENTLWSVVSVYKIPTEGYYLTTNFESEESYQKFLDTIISRSVYDFKTTLDTNDKILTLSTCYDDNIKVVLHAKLIKKS